MTYAEKEAILNEGYKPESRFTYDSGPFCDIACKLCGDTIEDSLAKNLGTDRYGEVCNGCLTELSKCLRDSEKYRRYMTAKLSPLKKVAIPQVVKDQVFERDGRKCVECGGREKLHCDHIIPESEGGSSELNNLQTLCQHCNCSKGARR